jgi:hypothetical protein
VIFFYEGLFVVVALGAVLVGELWSRLAAAIILAACFGIAALAVASYDARLAVEPEPMTDDERRWFVDSRDGLKHLRLLFALATVAALAWRLIAG